MAQCATVEHDNSPDPRRPPLTPIKRRKRYRKRKMIAATLLLVAATMATDADVRNKMLHALAVILGAL